MGTYLSEFIIDETDLPLDDWRFWTVERPDKPCTVLGQLGSLVIELTERMNELEPGDDNMIFMRVPFEAGS